MSLDILTLTCLIEMGLAAMIWHRTQKPGIVAHDALAKMRRMLGDRL